MKKILSSLSVIITSLSLSFNGMASELDSFTLRKEVLAKKDSLEVLNKIVRERLKAGEGLLDKEKGCQKKHLIKTIKKQLIGGFAVPFPQCRKDRSYPWVSGFKGAFESHIQKGKGSSKEYITTQEKKNSVYKKVKTSESRAISLVLGTLLNVRGLVIGSDKFGHFFSQGHEYYSLGGTKELPKVLEYGHCLETKVLGLSTSGVYSYGDLAANIMGMLFWERVAGEYFTCTGGNWKLNPKKEFNWNNYVSPSWDEGVNNSFYYSKSINEKVKTEIMKLQDKTNTFLTPPISKSYCEEMVNFFMHDKAFGKKHGLTVAKHAISAVCLNIYAKISEEKSMGLLNPEISLKKWARPWIFLKGESNMDEARSTIMMKGLGHHSSFNDSKLDPFWHDLN